MTSHRYDVCRHNHTFAVTLHDLKEWLSLKGMVPFGLETLVVTFSLLFVFVYYFCLLFFQGILESEKKLQHITDFTAGSPSFSGWILKTLASSIYWGYGKLVSTIYVSILSFLLLSTLASPLPSHDLLFLSDLPCKLLRLTGLRHLQLHRRQGRGNM